MVTVPLGHTGGVIFLVFAKRHGLCGAPGIARLHVDLDACCFQACYGGHRTWFDGIGDGHGTTDPVAAAEPDHGVGGLLPALFMRLERRIDGDPMFFHQAAAAEDVVAAVHGRLHAFAGEVLEV